MKNLLIGFVAAFVLVGCNSGCGGTIPTLRTELSPEGVSVEGSGEERTIAVEADGSGYGASGRGERINAGVKIRCWSGGLDICFAVGPISGLCFPLPEKVQQFLCAPTEPFSQEERENDPIDFIGTDLDGGSDVAFLDE